MRGKYPLKLVVGAAAITLLAAGCSGDGDDTEAPAQTDAAISVEWGNPENPLVPSNTTETRGGDVVDALWTGLINYNTETGEMEMANAESIEPDDASTVYTVKLKSGWTWHDGTPVVAQDYVDAWNWAAFSPNGAANGTFMADIKGYEEVHTEDPDEDGPAQPPTPKTDKMSGLEVVSETEFKVTLGAPSNLWPLKTGYSAFMALPKKFFEDPETFGKTPIGNGPFKFVSWTENVELKATRFDEYKGDDKAKIKDITWRVYQEDTAAYADIQSGNLDFQAQVPAATLQGDKYAADFPDHNLNKPVAVSEMIAIPFYRKEFQNVKLRQALSVAIDRNLITERIFNKTRIPMNGWVNPNVAGYKADQCGEMCQFNAQKAKDLLAEGNVTVNAANGSFVSNGVTVPQLSIQYNADASHKEWVDATCNSIQTATGIKCTGKPIPTFGEHRTIIDERKATSMFRAGWQADYPHIENWLNPLLRTGGSSNDGQYSSTALDAKLAEADGTQDLKQAEVLYQEAEAMLPAEMPTIPMWHRAQQSVWSERMKTVPINVFGVLEFTAVEVNEG